MTMRWFAAAIAAVFITGGAATVAQRVITQKTRGVLPETDDAAHADSRRVIVVAEPVGSPASPPAAPEALGQPLDVAPPLPVETAEIPRQSAPHGTRLPVQEPGLDLPAPATGPPAAATMAVVDDSPRPAPESPIAAALPHPADPAISPAAANDLPKEPHAAIDPVDAVDTFVERNRKEAETAIQSLSTEAENLRTRLIKVEAALGRWQNFSRALNADQPTAQPDLAPVAKANWKRSPTESASRPVDPPPADEPVKPEPAALPGQPSAEVPATAPVSLPAADPSAPPNLPAPGEKPNPEPPAEPPIPKS